jgi:hypothetical protein
MVFVVCCRELSGRGADISDLLLDVDDGGVKVVLAVLK